MPAIRFRNANAERTVALPASRSWVLPATGTVGTAEVYVPKSSSVYSSTYIDPDGGTWLTIAGEDGSGDWQGIVDGLTWDEGGVKLTAVQPWAILGRRAVRFNRTFKNTTPGYIATQALRDGLGGVGWLQLTSAPFENGGPHLREYEFSGQSVMQVLVDLMDASDHELHIDGDTDSGRASVTWTGALAYSSRYSGGLLVAGRSFVNVQYEVDPTDRLAEVLATLDNRYYRATSPQVAGKQNWPTQEVVSVKEPGNQLKDAATVLLAQRSSPLITITGQVTPQHYGIRERNTVRVCIPWASFTGVTATCRVIGRALDSSNNLMDLTLQLLPETPTGARPLPPGRTGNRRRAGRMRQGGGFLQEFYSLSRNLREIQSIVDRIDHTK